MRKVLLFVYCLFFTFNAYSESLGYDYFVRQRPPESIQGEKLQDYKDMIFVCTMGRCGTNLTLGILTFLTERSVFWSGEEWRFGTHHNRFNGPVNWDLPPILGTHSRAPFWQISKTENIFVTVTRNYKDLYFRGNPKIGFNANTYKTFMKNYLGYLHLYDCWAQDRRLLVYYEDLVVTPLSIVEKMALFLEADGSKLEDLLENFEEYNKRALISYNIHPGKSKSGGNEVGFHIKNVEPEVLKEMDAIAQEMNPDLFEKYLRRYLGS